MKSGCTAMKMETCPFGKYTQLVKSEHNHVEEVFRLAYFDSNDESSSTLYSSLPVLYWSL